MKKEKSKLTKLQPTDISKVSAGVISVAPSSYSGVDDNPRLTPRLPYPKKPIPGF